MLVSVIHDDKSNTGAAKNIYMYIYEEIYVYIHIYKESISLI